MVAGVSSATGDRASGRTASLARRPRWTERIAETLVKAVALVSIASVLLILVFVGKEALPVLTSAVVHREVTPLSLFVPNPDTGYVWQPVAEVPKYNLVPLFAGSLKVTLIALFFAVPLSVGAALFVAEIAGKRTREILKPAIELLAGIPSVVIGFFALVVLAGWVQRALGTEHRLNALSRGSASRSRSAPSSSRCRRTRSAPYRRRIVRPPWLSAPRARRRSCVSFCPRPRRASPVPSFSVSGARSARP
jgi:ABC-type phosphate transport system permease subunit